MNYVIVGNNCTAALADKILNSKFTQPFAYGGIYDLKQLLALIQDNIDLNKAEFNINTDNTVSAKIDNKIDVKYIHYTTNKYSNAIEYVQQAYHRRLARMNEMLSNNAKKIYVILLSKLCYNKNFQICQTDILQKLGKIDNVYLVTSIEKCDDIFAEAFNCQHRTLRVKQSSNNSLWKDAGKAFADNIEYMLKDRTQLKLENVIENSFVISINSKRLKFFYDNWKINLPGLPKHFEGLQLAKNKQFNENVKCSNIIKTHISCMSTQLMIITMAKALQLPFVCIFEDDAIGCINIKIKFEDLLSNIPKDADIILFGNSKTFDVTTIFDKYITSNKSYGAHSYIVFQKNYDYFINKMSENTAIGLCEYGRKVFIAKDILFCQYSIDPNLNQEWDKKKIGFIHNSLSKEYIDAHFKDPLKNKQLR